MELAWDMITSRKPMTIDGGLAAELESRGFNLDDELWSAKILLENPEAIKDVHRAYFEAGADIVITASYQVSYEGLLRRGHSQHDAYTWIRKSVMLAQYAQEEVQRANPDSGHLLVAASVGPYGAFLADGSEYRGDYSISDKALYFFHSQRIIPLWSGEPNIFAVETQPSFPEVKCILRVLRDHLQERSTWTHHVPKPPIWISFTLRDAEHIADGTPLAEVIDFLNLEPWVVAVGVNCVPRKMVAPALRHLATLTDKVLLAYPNSGEKWNASAHEWESSDECDVKSLEEYMQEWTQAGATMIGGCCRTGMRETQTVKKCLEPVVTFSKWGRSELKFVIELKNSSEGFASINRQHELLGHVLTINDLAMESTPHTFKIATIPGDGIGVDVTQAATEVLEKLASAKGRGMFHFEFEEFDWNSENYDKRGWYMPEDWMQQLKKHDAILFGALDQYINLRPSRILPGTTSPLTSCASNPESLDWLIVRENSEGEYSGQGGTTHASSPFTAATEVSIFTRPACVRTFRFAFEIAKARKRRHLTLVTKSNAQRHGMVLWDTVFTEIAQDYEGVVTWDKVLVDAMTVRMVNKPQSIDTVVATNLHADILTDLAAALSGSIGIAPSSNLDPKRVNPSMFEPIHGSAPDIAGKGVANPVGSLWSAVEMVRWLGEGLRSQQRHGDDSKDDVGKLMEDASDLLMKSVESVLISGIRTRDLGGQSSTVEVTESVCKEIEKMAA
ncbi:MAG: hypothetical protein M1831_000334 [Alyxoria varia]|nr:MAG: hypothetical protein M1831_000334 [Alyxoria varia]